MRRNRLDLVNQFCATEFWHHEVGQYQIDFATPHHFQGMQKIGKKEEKKEGGQTLAHRRPTRRPSDLSISFAPLSFGIMRSASTRSIPPRRIISRACRGSVQVKT